jgi:predicted DsbA family dithiol-disulfide isomerase
VEGIAREIGLNMEQFNQDLKGTDITSLIDRDFNEGRQENIRGVPTVFVNGRMLSQQSLSGLRQAIEAELKKKK